MLRALALFLFMCGQGVAVVKRRAQKSKDAGQVGFSGQGSSSMGVISADRLEQRPDLQGTLALLPLQPGDATSAVSVLVLLQQAVLSAHSEVRATRGFERFAEAAEVAGEAAHRESEDLDANLVGVPVSLLSSAVDGPAGKLLGPQRGIARAALARETELVRSVETRRQVAKHVQEANSLLSQPKVNDTVAKVVRVSGAWLQSQMLMDQGRHGVLSARGKLTPDTARSLAAKGKAPSFVDTCKVLIKSRDEPVEAETDRLCNFIQTYTDRYVACMTGKTDDSDAEFKDLDEFPLNNAVNTINSGPVKSPGGRVFKSDDETDSEPERNTIKTIPVKSPGSVFPKPNIESDDEIGLDEIDIDFDDKLSAIQESIENQEGRIRRIQTNDMDEEACKRNFPTKVDALKGAFTTSYRFVPYGKGKDKDGKPARVNNYAKLALDVPDGWGSIIADPAAVSRRNSVYSGFSMKIQIKFTNGWSIAFKPVNFKSLRFDVHDNLPSTPYQIGKASTLVQGGDVKFWKLNKIWESREFAPKGGFQFFGLTHPVNDGLALSWSFKRDYMPYPGYAAKLSFKLKGARTRENIKYEVGLGASVWPFDLSSRAESGEMRLRAGIAYGVEFSSGPWTSLPEYNSALILRAGVSQLVNLKPNIVDVSAVFSFEPFKIRSVGLQIRHLTEPVKGGTKNMGFGTSAQFGWESEPKPKNDAIILAWNFFKDVLFDNDDNEYSDPSADNVPKWEYWSGWGL